MNFKKYGCVVCLFLLVAACAAAGCIGFSSENEASNGSGDGPAQVESGKNLSETDQEKITITDGLGRTVTVPKNPNRVVCQGAGALRYLCYLKAQDAVVGVEDIELRSEGNTCPYMLANPQFQKMPLIGEFRGNTDPEKIINVKPQVIFWTNVRSAQDADKLSAKTGIPVIALNYGDLGVHRQDMYQTFRIMGDVMGKQARAEELIQFFNLTIQDLNSRTADIPDSEKKSVFVGGVAYAGAHGFQSTEPSYPPFIFVNAKNAAGNMGTEHADASKEAIMQWDPDLLFIDLSTLSISPSALDELTSDPAYKTLSAVKKGEIYAVLPYNMYSTNQGSVLADAYYVGKVLYPDRFGDLEPEAKADEIYTFLLGKPLYQELKSNYKTGFGKISLGK